MSTTIDERVVSMQFDNAQFERNVKTTMSTLDRLKQSLNLSGSAKGLENVGAAAKNVNMTGLGNAVETVRTKFSALEVMGVTALANITNSAVNAGKRIVKSLTIAPIKSGFNEYELKMGSIQTIMAGTGESLETVNKYLDELNTYSDQTIYSFQDMTSNIGKFTNAGVKLEDAVMAIKGISNEAAVSGANANEASRAMYNFAQALSSGYVKLLDWKSIELANMATVEFKNQLIAAAVAAGTLKDAGNGMYETLSGNLVNATTGFNDSLKDQWMTTEVLISTLKDYADENTDIGKKAKAAATEVKTFSMMMDTLKESIQSGWARTWEIVVGDFDQAKNLWTKVSNSLGKVVETVSDARNNLLEKVFGERDTGSWEKLISKITEAGGSIKDFEESVKKVAKRHGVAIDDMIKEEGSFNKTLKKGWLTKDIYTQALDDYVKSMEGFSGATGDANETLAYFQKMFDEVWLGNWGNGQRRIEKLTEAGHDYAAIQELVNKHTAGSTLVMDDLSEAQLKNMGLTEDQIDLLHELAEQAKESGHTLDEEIANLSKRSGRDLLIESFENIGKAIIAIFDPIKKAWNNVFGDVDGSQTIYNLIEGFNKLTESIIISTDTAGYLERIFDGLFYGGRLLKSVMGKSLVAMLNLTSSVLGLFGTNVLEVAAIIADYITIVGKWIDEHTPFIGMMNKVAKVLHVVIDGIIRCAKAFWNLDIVGDFIDKIGKALGNFFGKVGEGFDGISIDSFIERIREVFDKIEAWIKAADEAENIGQYIIDGLVKGLKTGAKAIAETIMSIANTLIETFCKILGIESPSKIFIALGMFIIEGLIIGIMSAKTGVLTALKELAISCYETVKGWFPNLATIACYLGSRMIEIIKNGLNKVIAFLKGVDWGSVIVTAFGTGMLVLAYKIVSVFETIVSPLEAITGMFKSIKSLFTNLSESLTKYFKAASFEKTSRALLNMAIAIGILAASVYVLSKVDKDDLWRSVGAVGALVGMVAALAGISVLLNKFGNFSGGGALSLMAMAGALLLLSYAMQKIAEIDGDKVNDVLKLFGGMIVGLSVLMLAFGKFCNVEASRDMAKAGKMLIKMAAAMLIMVLVIKIASGLDKSTINNGLSVVTAVGLLFAALITVSHFAGEHANRAGKMLLKISIAFLAMVGVIKLASMLDKGEVVRGAGVIALVGTMFAVLIAVSKLAGQNATKAGSMILMISAALMLIVLFMKQVAQMDPSDIKKGLTVITTIGLIFTALIAVSKMAGQHAASAGAMLLQMAGALLIMTGVMFLVSKFDDKGLTKSLIAITIMTTLMGGLIAVSKLAEKVKAGPLVTLVASIAVLTMSVYALSLIEPDRLYPAVAGLSTLLVAFGLLIASTKFAGKIKMGQMMPLLAMIIALSGIVAILSFIDSSKALPNVAALSVLLLMFTSSLFIMSKAGRILSTVSKQIGPMIGVVAALALIIGFLSLIDPTSVLTSTAALSILMLSFTGSLVIMSKASRVLPTVSKQLLPMLGVVAALALIVGFLSLIDPTSVLTSTAALSVLLLSFTGALFILGKANRILPTVSKQLLPMLGVIAVLALIVYGLSHIENPDAAIKMTGTLVTLLLAFTAVTAVLSTIGKGNTVNSAVKGGASLAVIVGIVSGLTILIGSLVGLIGEEWMSTIETGLDRFVNIMKKVGPLLLAFVPVTAALAAVGTYLGGAVGAGSGAFALAAVVTIIAGLAVLLGELMALFDESDFDSIENGLDRLKTVMTKIGEAIGVFVGGIFGGIAEGVLAAVGDGLSAFMNNAKDFIAGCGSIKEDVLTGAKTLAGAIAVISAADLMTGIVGVFDFGMSLPKLGSNLSEFMNNAKDFISGASDIKPGSMDGVKTLAEAVIVLTAANIIDGLAKLFSLGTSSISTFGEQLPILGSGLSGFATNLGEFDGKSELVAQAAEAIKTLAQAASDIPNVGGLLASIVGDNDLGVWAAQLPNVATGISGFITNLGEFDEGKVEIAKSAANVIKVLAEAAMNIPNTGGLLADLIGDNDLSVWAAQLPNVATGISGFITNLGEFDDSKVETAKAAAGVIKTLAQASAAIPNTGGLLADLIGDNDLSVWAAQLPLVGTGISGFLTNLGEFDEGKVATASCAAEVIKILADASQSIDGQAGWAKELFGDNSLGTFSQQFGALGSNIAAFVKNLGTFTSEQVSATRQAVSAIRAFSELADADLKGAKNNLEGFSDKLPGLGTDIASFCENMPSGDDISTAISNIKTILGIVKDMAEANVSTAKEFTEALSKIGEDGVKAFVEAFTSDTAKSDVEDAVKKLMDKAVDGIEAKEDDVDDAFDDIAESGAKAIKTEDNKTKFKTAGKYLGDGLIEGINAKKTAVYNAAYALGQKAVQGEKDGQKSKSPSRLTMQAGKWLGEGLIIGMERMHDLVYKSGSGLGETAINPISSAISNLADVVNTDIDAEPTIRPVLDLDGITSGIGTMNSMFDRTASVGVLANVNGISTMMNGRIQNGGNVDVVTAIDKLRKELGEAERTTYQINGITYDDGSNLRDAIETIVRYATIEGRV